jgi:hypothetical protein
LNDSREIEYGLSLATDILSQNFEQAASDPERRILESTRERLTKHADEIYVACFSEEPDLLSQWNGYASLGQGYAIGFDAGELSRFKRKFPFVHIALHKVVYQRAQQSEIVHAHLSRTLSTCVGLLRDHPESEDVICSAGSATLSQVLRHKAIFFKDDAFQEEREWRAIYVNDEGSAEGRQRVEFRVSGGHIVPYLPLDIGPSAQKKSWTLPIAEIVLGPRVSKPRIEKSIRLICKNQGIAVPELRMSRIPLQ